MKVGIALDLLTKAGHSDAAVFAEHMALSDLAELVGSDSLFALEHHSSSCRKEWPVAAAENPRLFADHVLPVLRRDPAFAGDSIDAPAGTPGTPSQPAGGILAPAA